MSVQVTFEELLYIDNRLKYLIDKVNDLQNSQNQLLQEIKRLNFKRAFIARKVYDQVRDTDTIGGGTFLLALRKVNDQGDDTDTSEDSTAEQEQQSDKENK